jgi:hypothetical protein
MNQVLIKHDLVHCFNSTMLNIAVRKAKVREFYFILMYIVNTFSHDC